MKNLQKSANPSNLSTAKTAELQVRYQRISQEISTKVENIRITSPEEVNTAVGLVKEIQFHEKEINSIRDGLVRPHNDFVKQINMLAKVLISPISISKLQLNSKLTEYNRRISEKVQEEASRVASVEREAYENIETLRKTREANEMALRGREEKYIGKSMISLEQVEIDRKAREEAEDKLRIKEEIALSKKLGKKLDRIETLRDNAHVSGMQSRWSYEILDESKIDRAYCSPDSRKINDAIRAGVREITGVRIYEKKIIC